MVDFVEDLIGEISDEDLREWERATCGIDYDAPWLGGGIKSYMVKEEFRDRWTDDENWDGRVSYDEIVRLSRDWCVSIVELLKEVEEV